MVTHERIKEVVNSSLDQLFEFDLSLIQDDVSERAITHKLAEYLQQRIPTLNVDCEYNRNAELGERVSKRLHVQKREIVTDGLAEEDLLAISSYPDIIVHRRRTNDENLLVVEVKKKNNPLGCEYDFAKLRAFTETTASNSYHYRFGVFILLHTGVTQPMKPEFTWFVDGEVTDSRSRVPCG